MTVRCPVCDTHDEQSALEAEGVVLSGLKAMFDGDIDTISAVYRTISPFEGHVAITLLAHLLDELQQWGIDVDHYIATTRRGIDARLAELAGSPAGDSGSAGDPHRPDSG